MALALPDSDAEIKPGPSSGGRRKAEPEMDKLSNIDKQSNDQFGRLFADAKRMEQRITGEIPRNVAVDEKYKNAKQTPTDRTLAFSTTKCINESSRYSSKPTPNSLQTISRYIYTLYTQRAPKDLGGGTVLA